MENLKNLKDKYSNFIFGKFDYKPFFTEQSLHYLCNKDPCTTSYSSFSYFGEYENILPKPYFVKSSEEEANAIAIYGNQYYSVSPYDDTYNNIPLFIVFLHTGQIFDPPKPYELYDEQNEIISKFNRLNIIKEYDNITKDFLLMWKSKLILEEDLLYKKLWYAIFNSDDPLSFIINVNVYSGEVNSDELLKNEYFIYQLTKVL